MASALTSRDCVAQGGTRTGAEDLATDDLHGCFLSIVIAARDEAKYLPRCLAALADNAAGLPHEVVVIDNASGDATAQIARTFGCRVIHEPFAGQLAAKHRGVAAARGQVVALLDADCIPGPSYLSAIENAFSVCPADVPAAVTCYYRFEAGAPWWARLYNHLVPLFLLRPFAVLGLSLPFVIGGNVAFRREIVLAEGGYPLAGGIGATEWTMAAILRRSGAVRYLPSLHVTSSVRRFEEGAGHFFLTYKLREYLLPLLATARIGSSAR